MSATAMLRCLFAFLFLCSQLVAPLASAQGDPKAAAHEHYDKGLAAFDDERFQEAAEEFEAAYRLSPAFAVLYNLGRVYVALGRSVDAAQAFEKYLAQGAAAVPPERRQEVRGEVERQRGRIGALTIRTAPPAADLRIDGKLIGKTPLADPVLVTAGKHTIEALLSGYVPQVREVDVSGRAQIVMDLRLDPVVESGAAGTAPAKQPSSAPAPTPTPPTPVQIVLPPTPAAAPVASTPTSEAGSSSNAMRPWGYAVAVVGLVAGATGGVVALTGVFAANDARNRAASSTAPSAAAQYEQATLDFESAKNQTQLGWTIAGVGAGVLLAGAVLVVISPDRKASAGLGPIAPWIAAHAGGVGISGAW
jgi:tetratricopeptide (TPR) repeat protein